MGDLHGDPVLSPFRCFWGGLHGGFVLSPLRSVGVIFLKMRPKNGRLTRGFRSFSVALFVFFKFAFGAVYTGESVFFSAFNAVLFCTFVVWRVGRAFGLPSIGFVNAV